MTNQKSQCISLVDATNRTQLRQEELQHIETHAEAYGVEEYTDVARRMFDAGEPVPRSGEGRRMWDIMEDDVFVGTIVLIPELDTPGWYSFDISVFDGFSGSGVGREATEQLLDELKAQGEVDGLVADVRPENPNQARIGSLLRRVGFESPNGGSYWTLEIQRGT
jgi:ribosomal protein S18 acetylase RimI-like enzyme